MSTAICMENQKQERTVALVGQPNSGKSTLFNGLTGARQHVGNWPGKTVEKKEGLCFVGGNSYRIVDLPGTYSLLAHSEEEMVARDFIAMGMLDAAFVLVDASQLERSLFLLADFAGIEVPVVVVLTMMDVAKQMGKSIDDVLLSKKLGVPVVPLVASNTNSYAMLYALLERLDEKAAILNPERLFALYEQEIGTMYRRVFNLLKEHETQPYSTAWLAVKVLEQDPQIQNMLESLLDVHQQAQLSLCVGQQQRWSLLTGGCKFSWISYLLEDCIKCTKLAGKEFNRFDHLATSRRWGKPLAIGIIMAALALSMVFALPIMGLAMVGMKTIPGFLSTLFIGMDFPPLLVSLVCNSILTAVFAAVAMAGYVFGVSLVFGFLEEIGYMARISYVFDSSMSKLGLQGKAVMPFLISFGCNIGGVSGTKIIDSWKQKILTISMIWVVPCASTWGVIALLGNVFFGNWAPLVLLSLFLTAVLHVYITSKLFGRSLLTQEERVGLIMELPPYHRPNYRNLFKFVSMRMGDVLVKALKVIVLVSIVFWMLSYSSDNMIGHSILYKIGTAIEPITMWFGLRWQTFTAFITSAIGKEAALGVFASVFSTSGNTVSLFDVTMGTMVVSGANLGGALYDSLTKAEALAFMFAYFFNVPCLMTVAATYNESHSLQWTLKIVCYYLGVALFLAALAYRIGLLLF